MTVRFLYVDADGSEVKVPSLDAFRVLVEDGVITEDTLLYDALSRDWATARFHQVYRLAIEDISRSWIEDEGDVESLLPGSGLGLLLGPEVSGPDVTAAFLEEFERERKQAELESGGRGFGVSGLRRDSMRPESGEAAEEPEVPSDVVPEVPSDVTDEDLPEVPPRTSDMRSGTRPEATTTARDLDEPVEEVDGPDLSSVKSGAFTGLDFPTWEAPAAPILPRVMIHRRRWSDGPARQWVLLGAVMLIGGWGIAEAWATDPVPPVDEEVLVHEARVASDALTAPGALRIRESAEAAFSDMTAGMQRIQAQLGVGAPPESWLSGRYLSDPESVPEAMAYWDRYEELVDSLRSAESDLFRAGFVTRLQRQGITGSVLSIRLARAMEDFNADRPRRELVYTAMEDLVAEARSLDAFLRENSDRIAYAGVRSGALSNDPATEAIPLDDETRERLSAHLDRLFLTMDEVTGTDVTRRRDLTGNVLELLERGG